MEREVIIDQMLFEQPIDLQKLFEMSRLEGGFLTDNIRKRVWPKILAINRYNTIDYRSYLDPKKDFTYITCDIERSLFSYDHLQEWDDQKREKRREALSEIIKCVLSKYPNFHYFQGYHDIVSIFLLILEDDQLTFSMVEVVSLYFFSDYMSEDFKIVSRGMNILMLILEIADPEVHAHISNAGVEAYFCTAWMLTWFSHDMKQIEEVARVFDALLCSHPLFIIYLCASLVLHYRDEVLECDCEFSSLHNLLVHLTKRSGGIPFEAVLTQADHWMTVIPPRALKAVMARGDLRDLLVNNKFHLLTKPDIPRYVDADWVLLQAHKLGESNRPHPFPPSPTEQSHQSEKKRSNGWMPKLYSKKSSHSELIPSLSIESSSSHPNDNDSASSAPAASPVDSASETTGPSLNGSYSPTANTLAANTSANANFSASIYLLSPRDSESDNKNGKAGKTLLSRLRSGAAGFFTGRKPSPKPNSPPKFTADSTPSIGIISASDRVSGDFSGINRDSTEHVHSTDIVPVIAESTVNVDGNDNNISNNSDNKASSSSSSSNLPSNPLQSQISASRVASVARRRRSSATSVADDETLITTRGSLRTMRDRPSSLYMKEPLNFNPAFDEKDSPAYIWLHKSAYLRYIPSTWEKLKDVATKNNLSTTLVVVAVLVGVAGVSYQLSHNQSIIQK